MVQTISGGKLAAKTNKARHGDNFYRKIGAKGGKLSIGGGFADGEAGRERARLAGQKGGRISKRKPVKKVSDV